MLTASVPRGSEAPRSFGIGAANREARSAAECNRAQRREECRLRRLVLSIDAAIASCEEAHLAQRVRLGGRARAVTMVALTEAGRMLAPSASDGSLRAGGPPQRMTVFEAMEALWRTQERVFELLAPERTALLAADGED